MASRLKERGGGGAKIMASKPHKPLLSSPPPRDKDNTRSLSACKSSGAGVRWSTSSIPRGNIKPTNVPDFFSTVSGLRAGGTAAPARERKSLDVPRDSHVRKSSGPMDVERSGNTRRSKFDPLPKNAQAAISLKSRSGISEKKENAILDVILQHDTHFRKLERQSTKQETGSKGGKVSSNGRVSNGKDGDLKETRTHGSAIATEICNGRGRLDVNHKGNVIWEKVHKSKFYTVPKKPEANLLTTSRKYVDSHTRLEGRKESDVLDLTLGFSSILPKHGQKLVKNMAGADDCKPVSDQPSKSTDANGSSWKDTNVPMKKTGTRVSSPNLRLDEGIGVVDNGSGKQRLGEVHNGNDIFENTSVGIKKDNEELKEVQGVIKNQSRLHEKLALLEGKVQKIALDIKRTKEMLDQNHTNESKLILSDIQSKVASIEKAVGNTMMDGNFWEQKVSDGQSETKSSGDAMDSNKLLNPDELESRFFPHQRFMRSRTMLGDPENQERSKEVRPVPENNQCEEMSLSSIEDDHIAMKFPASFDSKQPEIKKSGGIWQKDDSTVPMTMDNSTVPMTMVSSGGSSADNVAKPTVERFQINEVDLRANEKFEDCFDDENKQLMMFTEETERWRVDQLFEVGQKASTAGWLVSEGEAALLAHSDGSCSYYDIVNSEEKSLYKPPVGLSNNLWGDCWLIHVPGVDGCSGRYIVAASAGNKLEPAFCSWDFYTKAITAFRAENGGTKSFQISSSRIPLAPLTSRELSSRTASCKVSAAVGRHWWYSPCGPLIISTSSKQKTLTAYDLRDGDFVMQWDAVNLVSNMEYSSPLQWKNRDKLVVTEVEAISLWDVNSLDPQLLQSVPSIGKKIRAVHIHNTDAELGGGVRQRVSPSEVEGKDGVFCTQDSINVLDFRLSSGIGQRFSTTGSAVQSIFYHGDNVFLGCTESRLSLKNCTNSFIQQYSMRNGKLIASYALTSSSSHLHHSSITQVWGSSNLVMGSNGRGLFVFDAFKDDSHSSLIIDRENASTAKETIGPDDLFLPSFDYLGSRVLLVSRDRPAIWKYLM